MSKKSSTGGRGIGFKHARHCFLSVAALACAFIAMSWPAASTSFARVVRPAPDFTWLDANGKLQSFKTLAGQPAVLLIAPSPRSWAFRSQVGQIQQMYERLAAQGTLFFAAFTDEPGRIRSNIPFIQVGDGPRAKYLYETNKAFAIAIIGKDGNLDYLTSRVLSGQRIYDVIDNSFVMQEKLRRE